MSISARVYGYPPTHNAGSEWMLHSMLRPLAERGHQVTVWLSHPGKMTQSYDIDGVRVVPYHEGAGFSAEVQGCDLLLSQYENVPIVASLAKAHNIPVAVICHDNFAATFHNAAGADLVVYNSEWIRRDGEIFYAHYPREFLPKRTIVVRPPVRAEDYRTEPGECVTLVNLNADKGGDLFWKIAAWMPEWNFLGVRGAYGEQITPPLHLTNAEVLDSVSGDQMKTHVYSRSRVVLMPSIYESWGRVAVEAFASGIPVVAHPTPGLVEALGKAGIFAYRDDLNAWIQALTSLRDPANWEKASRRAQERSDELQGDSDLDMWCDAVESMCRGGARRNVQVPGSGPFFTFPNKPGTAAQNWTGSLNVATRFHGAGQEHASQDMPSSPAHVPPALPVNGDGTAQGRRGVRLSPASPAQPKLSATVDGVLDDGADRESERQVDQLLQRVGVLVGELRRVEQEYRQAKAAEVTVRERVRSAARRVQDVRNRMQAVTAQVERLTAGDQHV